jgi:hypothetical protein
VVEPVDIFEGGDLDLFGRVSASHVDGLAEVGQAVTWENPVLPIGATSRRSRTTHAKTGCFSRVRALALAQVR